MLLPVIVAGIIQLPHLMYNFKSFNTDRLRYILLHLCIERLVVRTLTFNYQ